MQPAISAILCLLFFVFVSFWILGQFAKVEKSAVVFPAASQFAKSKFTYKIISAPENTFGYHILNGRDSSSVTPEELKKFNLSQNRL